MKKKLLTMLFALAMTSTVIAGCGTKSDSDSAKDDKKTEASATKDDATTAPSDEATTAPSDDAATLAPTDDATTAPSDDATTAPSDDATTAPSDDATTAPSDTTSSTGIYKNMEEYISDPTVKASLDQAIKSAAGSGMTIDITAEGNTLIYKYTYKQQMSSDSVPVETLKQSLETAMNSQKDQMQNFANQIGNVVEETPAIISLQYIDADGTPLYEKEFIAQ